MKFTLSMKENKTFKYVLKKGKFAKGKYVNLYVLKINKKNNKVKIDLDKLNYLGICVSKKNGNSVERNKLKRWAREVYKNNENLISKGYYIIVLYKKTTFVNNTNYNLLNEDILRCLKELNIYEIKDKS